MLWLITKFNVFLPVPGGPFVPFVPRTPESYSDSRQIRWRRVGWDKEERYMIWTRCTHRWRYSNQLKTLNVHISGPVWVRIMKLCTHRPILGRNKWTLTLSVPSHEILGVHQRVHAAFLERSTFGQHPRYHGVLYIFFFGRTWGRNWKSFVGSIIICTSGSD